MSSLRYRNKKREEFCLFIFFLTTYSAVGPGEPDLELPASEMMQSFIELAALLWLLELSEGSSGKLLE